MEEEVVVGEAVEEGGGRGRALAKEMGGKKNTIDKSLSQSKR